MFTINSGLSRAIKDDVADVQVGIQKINVGVGEIKISQQREDLYRLIVISHC